MTYSKQFVDAVREAANIVEIVSEVVELKASPGDRYKGLCPFHDESSPSFTVDNRLYYCFGCGEGGDAIRFIERTQDLSFGSALRLLGDRYGINPETTTRWVGKPRKRPLQGIQQPLGYIPPTEPFVATYDPIGAAIWADQALRFNDNRTDFDNLFLTLGIAPTRLIQELAHDVGMSYL
jgi:CHC2 zinc finger